MDFHIILSGIVALFFVLLLVKEIIKKNFCVICGTVFVSWIFLLILNFLGSFQDKILLGILMGHTSLGLFYLFESKVKKGLKIFRLPLLMSFISIIYFVLSGIEMKGIYVLVGVWILFGIVYIFRNPKPKSFANKLIECCRNW